ncbi:MAG: response regulator transcription factor [Prevotella sp.]|nr:response regulator transcription factor [Prevotella sp.]
MNFIIADNQELTRFAIEQLLNSMGETQLLRASDKTELIEQLRQQEESVVVLDYTLFDFFDAENMLVVAQRFPKTCWLLMSDDLTEQFLRTVVYQNHNMSILFKDAPLKEVAEALHSTLRRQRYISQRVTEILLARQFREEGSHPSLTPTEVEITRAIAQGKTTKEIAAERFSSIHTITTHRKNIFRKLGVNTAHEAIKAAIRCGLIEEADYFI